MNSNLKVKRQYHGYTLGEFRKEQKAKAEKAKARPPKKKTAIKSFSEALDYVNRLGFAGKGTMQIKQSNLSHALYRLFVAAGHKGTDRTFRPFFVRYSRREDRFETWQLAGSTD
jgi:hypothetical protein